MYFTVLFLTDEGKGVRFLQDTSIDILIFGV